MFRNKYRLCPLGNTRAQNNKIDLKHYIINITLILIMALCAFGLVFKSVETAKGLETEEGVFEIRLSQSDVHLQDTLRSLNAKPEVKSLEFLKNKPKVQKKQIKLSREDFRKIAYTVEQECHELSLRHKILVAEVILNRVEHPKFPDTVQGVLTQKNQFQGYINYVMKRHVPDAETNLAVRLAEKSKRNNILFFYNPKRAGYRPFFENNAKLTHVRTLEGHKFFAMY